MVDATYQAHAKRVHRELIQAGATLYGLMKAESRYLPHVIHDEEHIHAVIYGQHNSSSAMLVATDQRILYLDKKPMATFMDEVTYDVVSGIEIDVHTLFATVTLHTAVTNYKIRYANIHCADTFTRFIEDQKVRTFLQRNNVPEVSETKKIVEALKNDLAGYYWIPKEEEKERVH
jgi:hypothetical protein